MIARYLPAVLAVLCLHATIARSAEPSDSATAMAAAAKAFLDTLDPAHKARAMFPFDSEARFDWHFIPKERTGVTLKEMRELQREAALKLLRTGLSEMGDRKITVIRDLETVLAEIEGPGRRWPRDAHLYHFWVFGKPSADGTWSWRYEGHHCSLSFTIVDGRVISTSPQFLGANPAEVRDGPLKGTRALKAEEDLARALVHSLDADQRRAAILSDEAPSDILTRADQKVAMLDDKGVRYDALNDRQQGMLMALIDEYARVLARPLTNQRLVGLRMAGLASIRFAWMGGIEPGQGHYYRVQGPTFLIEYDSTQNNANHIHAAWRDFDGDFGRDVLALHYQLYPHRFADRGTSHDDAATLTGNRALAGRLGVLSGTAAD